MFDLNLLESTITILYIKMPISDFFMYIGALIGFYKNYRANIKIYESQFESLEMSKEDKVEAVKIARYKYIRDNAKTHYMNIKRLVEKSEMKADDKALKYIENFCSALSQTFGAPPTEEEIEHMKLKAREIHEEVKLLEAPKGDK